MSRTSVDLAGLGTPALVLDEQRMDRNIHRLKSRILSMGVSFNPHLKTSKSVEIAARMMQSPKGPCTVSTLREAEWFSKAGISDITYAVGIAPQKLDRVVEIRRRGINLKIIADSVEQASMISSYARARKERIPTLIEIDTDGHRGGVTPEDHAKLRHMASELRDGGAELVGVLTHAGGSYNRPGPLALRTAAEEERRGAALAAEALTRMGFPCPIVSVGSSPTAHFAPNLEGVTEVRAGVFVFCDLLMLGLGVCTLEDVALSVLATVIGHQPDRNRVLVDAGWMAMSQDRSTASQAVDQAYGIVCDLNGKPFPDLLLVEANQEHGVVGLRPGSSHRLPNLPIGSKVRVLPNHACATAAQHARYHVVRGTDQEIVDVWDRIAGW